MRVLTVLSLFLVFGAPTFGEDNMGSEGLVRLGVFDFEASNQDISKMKIEDEKSFYTVRDLVKQALEYGLESQAHGQLLFRAREEVIAKLGHVLPQLDLLSTAESAASRHVSVHTVLPLVGFLFPNRWLSFGATRMLKKAQEENLATLFANQVQAIEHLYFDIQMQYWSLRVMDFYIDELNKIIECLKIQIATGSMNFRQEHISALVNRRATLEFHRAFMDGLASDLPKIASAIGLDPSVDWAGLRIEHFPIDFAPKPKRNFHDFYERAILHSSELESHRQMLRAAKRTTKAAYLNIFDPHSGHHLGIGYPSEIKIQRSERASILLEIESTKLEISNSIQEALNYYTEATKSMPILHEGLRELDNMRAAAEEELNHAALGDSFDFTVVDRFFQVAEQQTLNYIKSFFVYRIAVADFNRLTWSGEYYEIVDEYHKFGMPQFLRRIRKEHSFRNGIARKARRIAKMVSRSEDEDEESQIHARNPENR
jgi:hypothetical protein